jgi:hypothetical protein
MCCVERYENPNRYVLAKFRDVQESMIIQRGTRGVSQTLNARSHAQAQGYTSKVRLTVPKITVRNTTTGLTTKRVCDIGH